MHGNVVLNFTRHAKGDLHIYARGYQQAASALVEVFCPKPDYSDAESCPIVFLYRHAIELYLTLPAHSVHVRKQAAFVSQPDKCEN
jgi:hypothetical protein